jgi:hypothetical protein
LKGSKLPAVKELTISVLNMETNIPRELSLVLLVHLIKDFIL